MFEPASNTPETRDTNTVFATDRGLNTGEDFIRVVEDRINCRKVANLGYQMQWPFLPNRFGDCVDGVRILRRVETSSATMIDPRHCLGGGQPTYRKLAIGRNVIQVIQCLPFEHMAPERRSLRHP